MRREKQTILVGLAIAAAVFLVIASRRWPKRTPRSGWPVNLAHRGASARAPENTLEAFRLGLEDGAGGLELDAHMTRDGHVIVIHDEDVDRTTDGTGTVRDLDLADLQRLDAGCRFTADGSDSPYRGRGVRVPTLGEVFREFPEVAVNVEIKDGRPGAEVSVLRVIQQARAEGRTIVAGQKHEVIRRFRRISGGEIPTAASRREISVFFLLSRLGLEGLLVPAYDALQVPVRHRGIEIPTPRFLAAARSRGVRVDVWTINEATEMNRLLDLGADTIMTDRPEVLSGVLASRQQDHGS